MKRDDIIWRMVDDEVLLLDTCTGDYFCLNESGTRIWALFNENKTVDETAKIISDEYQISFEEAKSDVLELVNNLEESRIIEKGTFS